MLLTLVYPVFELTCKAFFFVIVVGLCFCFPLFSSSQRVAYIGMCPFSQEYKLVLLLKT